MRKGIKLFDSTLRDGSQAEGISFSVSDKIKIANALDRFGVDYIESGNPGSNEKDRVFFREFNQGNLQHAKLVAFGSTRRKYINASDDDNVKALLEADTPTVAIFGKSWDLHVEKVICTTLEENLKMIADTISYMKNSGKEVIFDAEHFFDGYDANPTYAINTILTAQQTGADVIVLCDTNGGTLPDKMREVTRLVMTIVDVELGIHTHDDMGTAIANSLIAIDAGFTHLQGTFTGFGERCGNANLSALIPTLQLKYGCELSSGLNLKQITQTARYINTVANIPLSRNLPYVGASAFSHKGGMHIDGVSKVKHSFEHVSPEQIGNKRRFLMSEVSGKSSIISMIQKVDPSIKKGSTKVASILEKLKGLEYQGYQFEGAESSFELEIRKMLGLYRPAFEITYFKTIDEKSESEFTSFGMIKIKVNGNEEVTAAEGNGPVNAMDMALRKALESFYPSLKKMTLKDYKVRVLDGDNTTAAKVRVLIESSNGKDTWNTIGVSTNIIEASLKALTDSIEYSLLKEAE
jgi:2-isopropylmalate synthase